MHQWLLDVWDLHETQTNAPNFGKKFNVTALQGWAYARALALRAKEDSNRSVSTTVGKRRS